MDPRYDALAQLLTGFSIHLKRGEKVLIEATDIPDRFLLALIRAVRAKKALPFLQVHHGVLTRELMRQGEADAFDLQSSIDMERMKEMDAYIAIRGAHNIFEFSDVSNKQMRRYMEAVRPVLNERVNNTRWVVLRWPHAGMAQQAGMSTEAFEDFYFRVCTLDYARMQPGIKALAKVFDETDEVRIIGPGETDLSFSIADIPTLTAGGHRNIPDGEVFTSPVRDSVEGVIAYNAPTVYQGIGFDAIRLEFEQGKIVKATAGNRTKQLNQILDSDEGARFIGEFAIGFNPHILEPMRDILFDEKIAGSFHFTPGQAYEQADNGNRSQVHWDMVAIQRKEWGGGEIYFDGKLIRKDGLFVPKPLQKLNPDYLLGTNGKGKGKAAGKGKKAGK